MDCECHSLGSMCTSSSSADGGTHGLCTTGRSQGGLAGSSRTSSTKYHSIPARLRREPMLDDNTDLPGAGAGDDLPSMQELFGDDDADDEHINADPPVPGAVLAFQRQMQEAATSRGMRRRISSGHEPDPPHPEDHLRALPRRNARVLLHLRLRLLLPPPRNR